MSTKSQQKSCPKNYESNGRLDYSSGYGSCSTLENDPQGEFRKMKEILHNLFELAKNELATIYKIVLISIQPLEAKFKNKEKITQ